MRNIVRSMDPEKDARVMAESVVKTLNRLNLSPGQWDLVEQWMDRVFFDPVTKQEFAVSDYIK